MVHWPTICQYFSSLLCLGTTGNGPRPEDDQEPDQRVALRTNGQKKTTGTEIAAGETAHGAGTAAGPGLETENARGMCTASPVVLLYYTNSKWTYLCPPHPPHVLTIIITILMIVIWNVHVSWKIFFLKKLSLIKISFFYFSKFPFLHFHLTGFVQTLQEQRQEEI